MIVIVVESHGNYSEFLVEALAHEGIVASLAADVVSVVAPDAILILVGPDAAEATAAVAELRIRHPSTLRMAVSDRDDVDLRVALYEAGADDCLSRPFHLRELVAKLRAMKRRADQGGAAALLPSSSAAVDVAALELRVGERVQRLTKREADLLLALGRAAGGVVRREDVLRDAWGAPAGVTGNLVDVYVGYARRKLDEIGADVFIKSVRGEGFRLVARLAKRERPWPSRDETGKPPQTSAL